MTMHLRTAAAAAGLLAMLSAPAAAWADASTPQHYQLKTREVIEHQAGEFDGILAMTIYPGGIVQGTYWLADQGSFRTVSGGLSGDRIWLDLGGTSDAMHVSGTFRDGVLDTVVVQPGPDVEHFRSAGPAHQL
jgi:hypothetical protein